MEISAKATLSHSVCSQAYLYILVILSDGAISQSFLSFVDPNVAKFYRNDHSDESRYRYEFDLKLGKGHLPMKGPIMLCA